MSMSVKKKKSPSVLSDAASHNHSQRYPSSTPPLPLRSLQLVARQPQAPVVLRERKKASAVRESWPRASAAAHHRSLTPPSRAHSVAETRQRPSSAPRSDIVSIAPTASVSQNPLLPAACPHRSVPARATPNGRGSDLTMMSLLLFYHSSSSLLGIDGKIEQAMDLVKSHLMLVVREEVELLREQLKDLQERNLQLERENHILRTLTHNIYSPTGHRISQ
ncbi:sperm acrosome developmental regulator-like isoform X1 [Poeciliopsis prolifica]|uniref:sperm acrosome developmental regulator-like isoform X1 n=1 Tax=Poeciliopsis prolifica TaxID=188132 RepID=UPI0024146159|nr:sperm acrosome developmental regulator-like isoform X1 [Poeciliopsis prolifica]XP_054882450.1 sperm acrosome developmental regulator-like isoform X1 [Poeciliopsis prolifica]